MPRMHLIASGLMAVVACAVSFAQSAPITLNIEAQPLDSALASWAYQTGFQVLLPVERSSHARSVPGLNGTYTPEGALKVLLATTDLKYGVVSPRTVVISATDASAEVQDSPNQERDGEAKLEKSEPSLIVAQNRRGETTVLTAESTSNRAKRDSAAANQAIPEVIVFAQKRAERLQDVPVPVSVVDAASLVEKSQVLVRDYLTTVPSIFVMPSTQSQQTLAVRGLTTGNGNPTVAVTIDDVSFMSSTNGGGGRLVPDIDPGDLARVEVLRGPQGTLYGTNSLGGLLKFVTKDPTTDGVSGSGQLGGVSIKNGDNPGYSARGAVNVPLGDTAAFRVSAFKRQDAGYIDNVQTAESGVNSADAEGGRLSALWRPSDSVSLRLGAFFQQIRGDGATSTDPALGDLQQSRLRNTGWYYRRTEALSLNLNAILGGVELTAISGYGINGFHDSLDYSYVLGESAQEFFQVSGASINNINRTGKFTQEIRLSMPIGKNFEWLLGGFYAHEDSETYGPFLAVDPLTGMPVGALLDTSQGSHAIYEEYAAFTDLTYKVTEKFDIQFGGRQAAIRQGSTGSSTTSGAFVGPDPVVSSGGPTSVVHAFTYLVTPRLKISPDLMVYARVATGYRPGGGNTNPPPGALCVIASIPCHFDPDESQNYEIGIKGEFFDHRLALDGSVYRIDWKDLQLTLLSPPPLAVGYTTNGSRARSQGVELSVTSKPLQGLTVAGWVAWDDAALTEDFPANSTAFGRDGDRLPISSRFSGYLSLQKDFTLRSNVNGFVGGSINYVGDRVGLFRAVAARQDLPAYTLVDLRTGVSRENWSASLFVTNVADKRGAFYGGLGAVPPTAFAYTQPRTIGIQLGYSFK